MLSLLHWVKHSFGILFWVTAINMALREAICNLLRSPCMSCFLLFGLRLRSWHETSSVVWRAQHPCCWCLILRICSVLWASVRPVGVSDLWSQHVQQGHSIAKRTLEWTLLEGVNWAKYCCRRVVLPLTECLSTGEGNLIQLWNWPCFEQAGPETSILWFSRPVVLQPAHDCTQKLPTNRSETWSRK